MIKKFLMWLGIGIALIILGHGAGSLAAATPLRPISFQGANTNVPQVADLGFDDQIWGGENIAGDKVNLLAAIDNSLRYLQTNTAARTYSNGVHGLPREKVLASVQRFRDLVEISRTPTELQAAVNKEFTWYKSIGRDNQGTVQFTAYFEPIYAASPVPTEEYRYPLYRLPTNLSGNPSRLDIEGRDGNGVNGPLQGLEIAWLRDRLQAYLVHVQGSARLRFPNGEIKSIGYAGKTSYSYISIGREMVRDGILPAEGLTLPVMVEYFRQHPETLSEYLPRNRSYVFFRETNGAQATGSIGVPVTADRSIATDKSLMPPGALAMIRTQIPFPTANGGLEKRLVNRFVLDQDTGGAIIGAGRVDIFLGTGEVAGDRAGIVTDTGELYYLLLKD